ncbi:AAA family ATPase [Phormidium sp. LEGE 05292]|uniref:AAA family ATPase n=1 Tax=[Phormidium] sp. LEGE 05292 TaxID=767427 RepID=UPI0018826CC2|nr:AAA family ATPase [Phormidium sp. LEGE 05292]MBE9226201.1 AAA family ATPase [Phormidium sp. LEGE 05292]
MSLNFTLLGWSASGLRCPDHEVSLYESDISKTYPVTLIQMPNGTGKTTTLNMLRATLSGSAKNWKPDEVRELRRTGSYDKSGQFIVRLAIDNEPLTFELNFDFKEGKAFYRTSSYIGIEDGFSPRLRLRKFFTPEFVKLFVFDGELAKNLLDAKQTKARQAIESLFQLFVLKELENKFYSNWEKHAESATAKSDRALKRRKNRLEDLKKKRDKIQEEQQELHKQKTQLLSDIQEAQQEYESALSKDQNIGSQLQQIKIQFDQAEKYVIQSSEQAIEKMRDPHRLLPDFGIALKNLKDNLDRLKLPTSTSKEFFEELAEAEECVCGRKMDEAARQAVHERKKNYLEDDEVGILNSIKSDIATYCREDPIVPYQELKENLDSLGQLIRKRDELQTELYSLEEARLSQGDVELEMKKKRLDNLKEQLRQCNERLEEIERSPNSKIPENAICLRELDKLIQEAENDVAEATETLTLKLKTDIAIQILSQAHKLASEELRKIILEETNQKISQVLSRNPVLLEDIQDSLKLQGQVGASEGQTLSVSYAFLATLFNKSGCAIPFIVDSPALSLDLNVRSEVANLIPTLCNQFVAFTISSERQAFVDVLHQTVNEQVQYLTFFRKTSRMNALWKNVDPHQIQETNDGVIIKGKDFFDRFDLDKEL